MPTLTLMTCGTSLLINRIDNNLRSIINKFSNTSYKEDIDQESLFILTRHIQDRAQELTSTDTQSVRKLSAELNGLIAWQSEYSEREKSKQDEYWLIATDTFLGQETANMIKSWLEHQGYNAQIISKSGLKTSNLLDFRHALSGLTRDLVETLTGYKERGYDINFNLTGGFKGINGFLQAFATTYATKTYYLFEGSEQLLYIPKLPYKINNQIIIDNLTTFRRISKGLSVPKQQLEKIPSIWLFNVDNEYMLSEWGELIWQETMMQLYKQEVQPSPSDLIIFENGFLKSCKKANTNPQLIELINRRIDDMAVYLENGRQDMLKSLDIKALQGKEYKDQKLHECDLDGNNRIFMIKDGEKMRLTELHDALH